MRRTARLWTGGCQIECPHCERTVGGGREFTAADLEAGQPMKCDQEGCQLEFRLPTKLLALMGAGGRRAPGTR